MPPPVSPRTTSPPVADGASFDPLTIDRALERTLAAEGALLLAPGVFDIEAYFGYTRRKIEQPALMMADDALHIAQTEMRRDEFGLGLRLRTGLPFASQFELDVPYRFVKQSWVEPGVDETKRRDRGLGDIDIGLAKTLFKEQGWRPDLVGHLSWNTSTGDRDLGGGSDELRLGATALKRQDPLAFTTALSYTRAFAKDNIKPGDQFGLVLGVSLAASPDTSLSFSLAQNFGQETKRDGRRIPGSDHVSSVLVLGTSSTIGRRTMLSIGLGIGLTDDAPDYAINLSLPLRFY